MKCLSRSISYESLLVENIKAVISKVFVKAYCQIPFSEYDLQHDWCPQLSQMRNITRNLLK